MSIKKYGFWGLIILLCILIVAIYFLQNEYQFKWLVLSEMKEIEAVLDTFDINNVSYEIPGPLYFIQEKFIAAPLVFNTWAHISLGIFYVLFLSYFSAIIAKSKPMYFYIGISLLFLVMALGNFDLLYGQKNQILGISHLLALAMVQYLCRNFTVAEQNGLRFVIFLLFWGLCLGSLGFIIEPDTVLQWVIFQLPAMAFFYVAILFYLGYDLLLAIIRFFEKPNSHQNFKRYTISFVLVFIQLIFLFLQITGQISPGFSNVLCVLFLCALVCTGFWNLNLKQSIINLSLNTSFNTLLQFYLVIICFVFCFWSYQHFTVNQPMIEWLQDILVFSQLAMTIAFFLYIFINFYIIAKQKYSIFPILYKPYTYKFYYFRGLGLLLFFLLGSYQNFKILDAVRIGYFIAIGDFENAKNNSKSSEINYKQALSIDFLDHRANYSLGHLAMQANDFPTAGAYFRKAIQKQASPFAYASLSYCLEQENQLFEQLFLMRNAHINFPNNAQLCNNLALVHEKAKTLDSSLFYLKKAIKIDINNASIHANHHAFYLQYGTLDNQKTYLKSIENLEVKPNNSAIANALALYTKTRSIPQNKYSNIIEIDTSQALSYANFAWLHNYGISSIQEKKQGYNMLKFIENQNNANLNNGLTNSYIYQLFLNQKPLEAMGLLQSYLQNAPVEKQEFLQKLLNTFYKKTTEFTNLNPLSITNLSLAEDAFVKEPLNIAVLEAVIAQLNNAGKTTNAYQKISLVKNFLPESIPVSKLFILQALKIFEKDYAVTEMEHLRQLSATEYASFLSVYQRELALVEKTQQGFE